MDPGLGLGGPKHPDPRGTLPDPLCACHTGDAREPGAELPAREPGGDGLRWGGAQPGVPTAGCSHRGQRSAFLLSRLASPGQTQGLYYMYNIWIGPRRAISALRCPVYQVKDGERHSVVEPEPDRNLNFSKVGSGSGTITFQKLEQEP